MDIKCVINKIKPVLPCLFFWCVNSQFLACNMVEVKRSKWLSGYYDIQLATKIDGSNPTMTTC